MGFYFCHIHNKKTGRIKVLDSSGSQVNANDTPELGYDYPAQSDFDESCGTFGLDLYKDGSGMCDDTFVCGEGSSTTSAFGECLKAMDCAMDYKMRTYLSETSAAETFMHQMIPHHRNAVNMAKALLKDGSLTSCEQSSDDGNADCGIEIMLWDIINTQNHQINTMEAWLSDGGYAAVEDAVCEMQDGISSGNPNNMGMVVMGAIVGGAVVFVLLVYAQQVFCQAKATKTLP